LVELKPPSTQERYQLFKEHICPELKAKEVQLQSLAQKTEYFLVNDLYQVYLKRDSADLCAFLDQYKQQHFPSSVKAEGAPSWHSDIAGLHEAK
jgi:SpoVK/Ycf46/Vps4 family AAA+-type ATPase